MASYIDLYVSLRDEFISLVRSKIDNEALQVLKHEYAEGIGSIRKLSYTTDLQGLIKLLEKRDILSYRNIEPFWNISKKFFNSPDVQNKLVDYKRFLENLQQPLVYNMYQDGTAVERVQKNKISSGNATEQFSNNSSNNSVDDEALKNRVLLDVSERLGRSWRDVSRYLGVRECDINAIESKYPLDLKEQSYQALQIALANNSSGNWKNDLLRALEKGRRRDLRERVEKVLIR